MPAQDRLFTHDIKYLALYQYDPNVTSTWGLLSNLLTVLTNCKLSYRADMRDEKATWETHRRPIPGTAGYYIDAGTVIDSTMMPLMNVVLNYGSGPFRILYNNGTTQFMAYCYISNTDQDAPGEAQSQSCTLEIDGQPVPVAA